MFLSKKPEMQFNFHWIVHTIEISGFSQSRFHIWSPRRLSGHISSASFGNFITLVDNMAKFS